MPDSNSFWVHSEVNPASLAVNIKNLTNDHLPPSVKQAQEDLIYEIKKHLILQEGDGTKNGGGLLDWLDGEDVKIFKVKLEFGFLSDRSDLDGPIKRVLDALQRAITARGYHWNDHMVYDLQVLKYLTKHPAIQITVEKME